MRIRDLIKDLQKLEKEYPDHEVKASNGLIVDGVEKSTQGPQLTLRCEYWEMKAPIVSAFKTR